MFSIFPVNTVLIPLAITLVAVMETAKGWFFIGDDGVKKRTNVGTADVLFCFVVDVRRKPRDGRSKRDVPVA